LLAHRRWFSPGTPASSSGSTTKTGRHDIAETLCPPIKFHGRETKACGEPNISIADAPVEAIPPGGATAVTAIIGGTTIHNLGYAFVIMPIFFNSLILLTV
jgi:hypothetical protein